MERTSDGEGSGGGGGPSLEFRVARLEDKMDSVATTMKSVEAKLVSIAVDIAEIKGKASQSPTWLQLVAAIIATWSAGAAIVFTMIRFAPK